MPPRKKSDIFTPTNVWVVINYVGYNCRKVMGHIITISKYILQLRFFQSHLIYLSTTIVLASKRNYEYQSPLIVNWSNV